jgi:hypothetical protein
MHPVNAADSSVPTSATLSSAATSDVSFEDAPQADDAPDENLKPHPTLFFCENMIVIGVRKL